MVVRSAYLVLGVVATGLAIAGAVLPLLPTTPFLLVAAWAFMRSSPRLHARLLAHPRFGPALRDWQVSGAIARRAKWMSAVVMLGSLAAGAAFGLSATVLVVQAAVLAAVSVFIWTRPEPLAERGA